MGLMARMPISFAVQKVLTACSACTRQALVVRVQDPRCPLTCCTNTVPPRKKQLKGVSTCTHLRSTGSSFFSPTQRTSQTPTLSTLQRGRTAQDQCIGRCTTVPSHSSYQGSAELAGKHLAYIILRRKPGRLTGGGQKYCLGVPYSFDIPYATAITDGLRAGGTCSHNICDRSDRRRECLIIF